MIGAVAGCPMASSAPLVDIAMKACRQASISMRALVMAGVMRKVGVNITSKCSARRSRCHLLRCYCADTKMPLRQTDGYRQRTQGGGLQLDPMGRRTISTLASPL